MASSLDSVSMALFCDFENVALGVRDANYEKFDIKKVLERLLLKGSIVVKKAYCDWERYKGFKAAMHEANFELIEIPHVRQSGKNSADIRLVVDALDLCYTKSHVDTFVIISGDSDFSPLVSKLRENAKQVIGVGVKQSTSDLLIANCDEFIFYDDLVREQQRTARKESREAQPAPKRPPEEEARRKQELEQRRGKAIELAVETFEALLAERGESGKIWASMLKEAIKRRNPGFNESYYGFRVFGNLLDEAQARGLLTVGRDEKSGAYVQRVAAEEPKGAEAGASVETPAGARVAPVATAVEAAAGQREPAGSRKAPRRSRKGRAEGGAPVAAIASAAGSAGASGEASALAAEALPAGEGPLVVEARSEAAAQASDVLDVPNAQEAPAARNRGGRAGRARAKTDVPQGGATTEVESATPAIDVGQSAEGNAKPAGRRRGRSATKAAAPAESAEDRAPASAVRNEPVVSAAPAFPATAARPRGTAVESRTDRDAGGSATGSGLGDGDASGDAPRAGETPRRGGNRTGAGRRTGKRKPAAAGE